MYMTKLLVRDEEHAHKLIYSFATCYILYDAACAFVCHDNDGVAVNVKLPSTSTTNGRRAFQKALAETEYEHIIGNAAKEKDGLREVSFSYSKGDDYMMITLLQPFGQPSEKEIELLKYLASI